MTIQEMKRRKEELGLTAEMISGRSGVPLSTVQKIFSGVTKAPRKATIDAILRVLEYEADYLQKSKDKSSWNAVGSPGSSELSGFPGRQSVTGASISYLPGGESSQMRDLAGESAAVYHYTKPGGYTVEDYYALPDERRVELIDGVFYDMAAPAIIHQRILGELHILFRECMDRHEGECEVYLSPCDVRLDRDNRTMVQPDLLVVCREYDIGARAFEGAPDLTLEILSPSTRSKDMLLKLHKYAAAGVREYWIVDPDRKTVLVYDLEKEDYYPAKYGFEDEIPIRISGGACSIDFSRVMKRIARYYETV